ncbi:MAG TPA: class I SAM-dependent methyltransferase [Acidobacteriaceae bacterium]|jgi:hypothetical protein|nr:class I SAM-dependent methyltransferase [Acidobacteriaceae bacterium]
MLDAIEHLISEWDNDHSLLEADQLSQRLNILDRLDAYTPIIDSQLSRRAEALCARLEAANSELYQSIRSEIQHGVWPPAFLHALQPSDSDQLPRGNGYDHLDELVSGVLQLDEPDGEPSHTGPENVFYQPTPARHIFALIQAAAISASDVLIDLGSGLGHIPLVVSACTGAHTIGIELEPSFIASARQCAQRLNLGKVTFLEQDASSADFSTGTIFYLYTPFTGSILQSVLSSLRKEATTRPIKICTFGPCTLAIAHEPWLIPTIGLETDQIALFSSHA